MSSPRLFSAGTVGNLVTNTNYVFDPTQVSTDGGQTGMYRALQTTDYPAVTLLQSGVAFVNVGITGSPTVTLNGGTSAVTLTSSTANLAVTGGSVNVTNTLFAVSGVSTPAATTYTSFVSGIIATGQLVIPAAAKQWNVYVVSGAVWVKGFGPLLPATNIGGGSYGPSATSATSIGVGGTGAGTSAVNAIVTWDT